MATPETSAFVLCVRSDGYEASLEPRKIYRVVADADAASKSLLRVIEESGEDYLYPRELFVPIEIPEEAIAAFPAVT
jgi:hypothetical protein